MLSQRINAFTGYVSVAPVVVRKGPGLRVLAWYSEIEEFDLFPFSRVLTGRSQPSLLH